MTATTYSERTVSALSCSAGAGFGGDDDLRDAGAVAQIEKDEVAEVAAPVHPAHEDDA